MATLLAQLTDLHIREPGNLAYGRLDTAPYLRTAVASLLRLPQQPHAVVLTGDLTDWGRPAQYAHLAELLAPLPMPLYLMPGNHDDRDELRRAFPGHTYLGQEGFLHYAVNIGPPGGLRLVALDTLEPGASGGVLCRQRLDWLEGQLLACRPQPVIVAMHHPPFRTLIGHMDRIALVQGAEEFEALLQRHPHVERVVCGHVHRTIYTQLGGRVVSVAPSPAHQVCLDLAEDAASAWVLEPPGFHLHAWSGPGRLVTHAVASGQFDGPHSFRGN